MTTIVTRAGKGSALTHNEVDANFNNLNTDKAELSATNTFTNATGQIFRQAATQDGVLLRGRAGGTSGFTAELVPATLSANRVITLPNASGTVVTTGDSGTVTSTMIADGTIVDADISATAEIAVSKLADGAARQLLQTDAAGTGVEWTSNVNISGTLDVVGTATFGVAGTTNGSLNVTGSSNESITLAPFGNGVQIYLTGTSQELYISANNYQFTAPGGFRAFQIYNNFVSRRQSAVAYNTTATLIASEMAAGLITSTTPASVSLTLPTVTAMNTYLNGLQSTQFSDGQAFEWSVINTGALNAVTLVAATGHTITGRAIIAANTSGRFTTLRVNNTTYITYRIA